MTHHASKFPTLACASPGPYKSAHLTTAGGPSLTVLALHLEGVSA